MASCTTTVKMEPKEKPAPFPEDIPPVVEEFYSDPILLALPIAIVIVWGALVFIRERNIKNDHS
tara:strand:- start:270 stop:461 length:192 start_codon:yes stop_codon:yes gene_type:complete